MISREPLTCWLVHNRQEGFKVYLINKVGSCLSTTKEWTEYTKAKNEIDDLTKKGFTYLGKIDWEELM